MAKNPYKTIENINKLNEPISSLSRKVSSTERRLSDILYKLNNLDAIRAERAASGSFGAQTEEEYEEPAYTPVYEEPAEEPAYEAPAAQEPAYEAPKEAEPVQEQAEPAKQEPVKEAAPVQEAAPVTEAATAEAPAETKAETPSEAPEAPAEEPAKKEAEPAPAVPAADKAAADVQAPAQESKRRKKNKGQNQQGDQAQQAQQAQGQAQGAQPQQQKQGNQQPRQQNQQGGKQNQPKAQQQGQSQQGGKGQGQNQQKSGGSKPISTEGLSGNFRTDPVTGKIFYVAPKADTTPKPAAPAKGAQGGKGAAFKTGQGATYKPGDRQGGQGGFRAAGQAAGARPGQGRPAAGAGKPGAKPAAIPPAMPAPQPGKGGKAGGKKYGNTYVEKDKDGGKKSSTTRKNVKSQGMVGGYVEDESGFVRIKSKKAKVVKKNQTAKIEHAVVTTEEIPLKTLSEKLGVTAVEITKKLFKEGIMKTVNESVDYDTAAFIAADLGIELEYKPEKTAEEKLSEHLAETEESTEALVPRAPVVTVMGHVDHGKTSLLDYIRNTKTAAGEAGGITQHIGAYTANVNGKKITFIDTPGHEAFTAMRARGAQVTDIVILVVAADDGIMPQTVEAINHAKSAGVEIIVAINKIDKAGADIMKVEQGLTNYDLVPEAWGGHTICVPISAKTGEGVDELLENLLLLAEMLDLRANPERDGMGTVIEACLDKGKGPMATVLVQNGTLHTGDYVICGTVTGRVRAMIDDTGRNVKAAGPSMAVNVLGLDEVPSAGDAIHAVPQALMKQVMDERKRKESDAMQKTHERISLEDLFSQTQEGNLKTLNLIIKADVQGSVEAIKQSVVKLSNEEVTVKVIHSAAGAVNESDVMLAESAKAIILGFNVRPDAKAKALADKSKVDVRQYRVIYDLLDDVTAALKGMLAPKFQDVLMGKCEVRQTFRITGVGNVAGCYVTEGKIVRGGKLRIYRDDILIVEGGVKQLKRFKDDVKEVSAGFECGCAIDGFNEIQIGDIIECYITEQIQG